MRAVSTRLLVLLSLAACSSTDKAIGTATGTLTGANNAPAIGTVDLTPDPGYEQTLLNCQATGIDDPDGDVVTVAYSWTVNGVAIAAAAGTLNGDDFSKNDTVSCTATPNDGVSPGSPVSSNIVTILNTAPSGTGVEVNPDPANQLDTLTALPIGWSDVDGDTEKWDIEWFVNSTAIGATGDTLFGAFVKGDEVYAIATPNDLDDLGDPLQSNVVTILNTPPTLTDADITPGAPFGGDILLCSPSGGTDLDGDTINYLYEWFVNGSPAGSGTELLAAPSFTRGDDVYCVITPTDLEDDGPPITSNIVTIRNAVPSIASVTLAPEPAYENTVLNCTPTGMNDADGDAITLAFSWSVGGLPVAGIGSSLDGSSFNRGQAVQCTVTANDGLADSPPALSNLIVIQNTPPTALSANISPIDPQTQTDVTVVAAGWNDLDGDAELYQYQWYVDGIALPGATSNTLLSVNYVKHNFLTVTATPFDGIEAGVPLLSPPVEVQNTPPSAPIVQISPTSPDLGDSLVCSINIGSTDADGDLIIYGYSWTKNSVPTTDSTNSIPAGDTQLGDVWECIVTPDDGEDFGPVGSSTVVVVDTVPPDAPVLDPLPPYGNDDTYDVTGNAEGSTTITLYATCDDGSSGSVVTSSDPSGFFDFSFTANFGEDCDFYVTSEDFQGNVSDDSNHVDTLVCPIPDIYEGGGYGDLQSDAIDEWTALPDDGIGSVYLEGNILDTDAGDWFVVYGTDDVAADTLAGSNQYNFHIQVTDTSGQHSFVVHKGDLGFTSLECSGSASTGYDEYNDYVQDIGDGTHAIPSPTNLCGAVGSATRNECTDMGIPYFIEIIRDPAFTFDCTNYELTVTNGL